jgi:NAD(P)-dependent dehydrogenase (short-subunit alcohol dehydrogenase family)
MSIYWVFGGSKALGAHLVAHLAQSHQVVTFSRSRPATVPVNVTHIAVDFEDVTQTRHAITMAFAEHTPAGAVFCQRYRPKPDIAELDSMQIGLAVELGPAIALNDVAQAAAQHKPLSLVLLSSVAADSIHLDIGLGYHVLKSASLVSARFFAARNGEKQIRANSVVLGEFEKYPRESYTAQEQKKFEMIERCTPSRHICSKAEIANVVDFLLSDKSSNVTGQTLRLDGHLSGLAPESILRHISG